LVVGLAGLLAKNQVASSVGLFLFALLGFGSAPLMFADLTGFELLSFSAPLGLAISLIIGSVLVATRTWTTGSRVFWYLVLLSACVQLAAIWVTRPHQHVPRHSFRSRPVSAIVGEPKRTPRSTAVLAALTGAGLLLCLTSAFAIAHFDPGPSGILGHISPAWYLGLAVLIFTIVLGQVFPTVPRLVAVGAPVMALDAALKLTPAIAYDDPRYAWTLKHVGVVSYILLHGSVNPNVDIYQAWPGLFSGMAWLCNVSHLASPISVARWWTPVIDMGTLLVFYQLASVVLRDSNRAWLASMLFVAGNAINDADYFSPQSAGYLFVIATLAVVFRHRGQRASMGPTRWALVISFSVADAVTHQLSPYEAVAAVLLLGILGYSRLRWVFFLVLAPAVAWAILHWSYVKTYFPLGQVLDLGGNTHTPGAAAVAPAESSLVELTKYAQAGGDLLIGIVALVVLFRARTRLSAALALCAAGSGFLIFANSYGGEADYRVALFALPWLAVLALSSPRFSPFYRYLISFALIPILLATYVIADMGLDYVYAVRPGDVKALQFFELRALPSSTLIVLGANGNFPENVTGRYNLMYEIYFPYVSGLGGPRYPNAPSAYRTFMGYLERAGFMNQHVYVLSAEQPAAYLVEYGYTTIQGYRGFTEELAQSHEWRLVLRTSTARLFLLQPTSSGPGLRPDINT
jgi:hypothetical protein